MYWLSEEGNNMVQHLLPISHGSTGYLSKFILTLFSDNYEVLEMLIAGQFATVYEIKAHSQALFVACISLSSK